MTFEEIAPNYDILITAGTIDDPYDNLMDAIKRAFEIAAPYKSASIQILLFPGIHYLVRGYQPFYLPINIDEKS